MRSCSLFIVFICSVKSNVDARIYLSCFASLLAGSPEGTRWSEPELSTDWSSPPWTTPSLSGCPYPPHSPKVASLDVYYLWDPLSTRYAFKQSSHAPPTVSFFPCAFIYATTHCLQWSGYFVWFFWSPPQSNNLSFLRSQNSQQSCSWSPWYQYSVLQSNAKCSFVDCWCYHFGFAFILRLAILKRRCFVILRYFTTFSSLIFWTYFRYTCFLIEFDGWVTKWAWNVT